MIEIQGDIWEFIGEVDVICITTNGFLKKNEEAVLGAGVAKGLRDRLPQAEKILGYRMKGGGAYNIHEICKMKGTRIWSFPVKPIYVTVNENKSNVVSRMRDRYKVGEKAPGFHSLARMDLITQSANKVYLNYIKENLQGVVLLPKPGCYNGGLLWKDVKETLLKTDLVKLNNNLHIIDLKQEKEIRYENESNYPSDQT